MSFQRKPIEIKRLDEAGIRITWNDGVVSDLSAEKLRKECPCATCRSARGDTSHERPLAPTKPRSLNILTASAKEETQLQQLWAIGNYAIGIQWGDGHSTGIYTFEQLATL